LELLFVGIGISYLVHRGMSFFGGRVKPPPSPEDKVSCGG
jgi:hypothetical protein